MGPRGVCRPAAHTGTSAAPPPPPLPPFRTNLDCQRTNLVTAGLHWQCWRIYYDRSTVPPRVALCCEGAAVLPSYTTLSPLFLLRHTHTFRDVRPHCAGGEERVAVQVGCMPLSSVTNGLNSNVRQLHFPHCCPLPREGIEIPGAAFEGRARLCENIEKEKKKKKRRRW